MSTTYSNVTELVGERLPLVSVAKAWRVLVPGTRVTVADQLDQLLAEEPGDQGEPLRE